MSRTQLSRRGFLAGSLAVGVGCAGTTSGGGGAGGSGAGAGIAVVSGAGAHWTTAYFGHAPTRVLVWRRPGDPSGSKLKGFFREVYSWTIGAPAIALKACSQSEHYWAGDGQSISVLRGVPAALDPLSLGIGGPNGRPCRVGAGDCMAEWQLARRESSGVSRYTRAFNPGWSLYVLPGGTTWIVAPEYYPDLRLGADLASSASVPPLPEMEPGAVLVDQVTREHGHWEEVAADLPPVAGSEQVFARTTATFSGSPGADVPTLLRWHFPDADRAASAAADYARLAAALKARYPDLGGERPRRGDPEDYFGHTQGGVQADGASLATRGLLPYEAIAGYVGA
jgi:hypothetical protein